MAGHEGELDDEGGARDVVKRNYLAQDREERVANRGSGGELAGEYTLDAGGKAGSS